MEEFPKWQGTHEQKFPSMYKEKNKSEREGWWSQ